MMGLTTTRVRPALVLVAILGMIAAMLAIVSAQEAKAFPGANGKIVFESGSDIWVMNADGSAPGLIHVDGEEPAWSADGQKIAYRDTTSSSGNIWVMNADGSLPTQISSGNNDYEPAWSPDGTSIVFRRRVPLPLLGATGTSTALDATGTTLTDAVPNLLVGNVEAGMEITNNTTGGQSVVTGATPTTVTMLALAPLGGGWHIGDTYTITAEADRVYKINVTTTVETLLSTLAVNSSLSGHYNDYAPDWSPDGTLIAYSTSRNGNDDIYTMLAAGEGAAAPINLTLNSGPDELLDVAWDPAWSPGGDKIAFASALTSTGGSSPENIWVMNADGSAKTNLTSVITDKDESTSWSPDGTSIAFGRTSAALAESVLSVPAGGGAVTVLAPSPPNKAGPDWQPILGSLADAYSVDEGAALVVPAAGVLTNDWLLASGVGPATAVKNTDPANGTLALAVNGSFTYTHNGSETTSDSFTYHPTQGGLSGPVATVTITIKPIDSAPIALNDGPYGAVFNKTTSRNAPGVLGNDIDPEGGALTAVKVTDPAHGTVTLNADGSFSYTNNGDPATSDSFTYQAKDAAGNLSNVATASFTVGDTLATHTTGLVDPLSGKWYMYDDSGKLTTEFFFGNPGDFPFMGDWNGDGVETPGLYRQSDGFVYIRNSNTQGAADVTFFFGNPGDVPVAGDFNGDGLDTVSIYRPSNQTFFIINELGKDGGGLGAADFAYVFGNPGDKPFVGDFDGDGLETVGLHRESTGLVYFRNSHSQGNADNQFIFGDPGDRLVAGDWTGDGVFTPALFRPSDTTFYFRHTNTQGNADNQYVPAPVNGGWLPVSGSK